MAESELELFEVQALAEVEEMVKEDIEESVVASDIVPSD